MTATAPSLVGTFVADPFHSLFQFAVKHMGVSTFKASFDDFEVTATADDQGVRVEGTIRVHSLSIKQPDFRAHVLEGPDFFDAKNYPEMTFRTTNVDLREDGTAEVAGELTIKGITKPFTATGTYQPVIEDLHGKPRTAVEFEAEVDRRDWDFNWQAPLPKGGDALGNKVKLTVNIELVKKD